MKEGKSRMDPFVATICKQATAIAGAFVLAGVIAALIYGFWQYGKLQHALSLNMLPPALS